jgi:phospholipase D1/2
MMQLNSNSFAPRQPWHDLHCKIEGPAAYDILTNFEQRSRKAKKWRDFRLRKVTNWHDDALLRLDRISWIVKPSSGPEGDKSVRVTEDADPESWHVQVHIYVTINLFAIRVNANIFYTVNRL